jgi:spermidine synthase
VGSLGIILLLFALHPTQALRVVALGGLAAAAVGVLEIRLRRSRTWLAGLLMLMAGVATLPGSWLELRMSEYKELSQLLRVPETRVLAERSSPLGLLTVIESGRIPLRHAPGLSMNAPGEPPPQLGILTDGDSLSALVHYDGRRATLEYLDWQSSALSYHLAVPQRVLILGAGGGSAILQALYQGAEEVDAVELDQNMTALLTRDFREFSGWELLQDRVRLHIAEARAFVAANPAHYDLIQVSLVDSANAASAGVYALSESYLYTVEAVQAYLRHLRPDGYLSITRWVHLPPRDGLKLLGTAVEALRAAAVPDPGSRLVMIRGWNTSTLVVKRGPFLETEIERLRRFCQERSFDTVWYPGMRPEEANNYNRLARPYFHQAAQALLGNRPENFIERYKFQIAPASDDRPYYFNFFRWAALPEILELWGQGGMPLLELGYPVLLLTLAQALLASLVLILLPLALLRRRSGPAGPPSYTWRVAGYFLALGLAFLFLEIAFIQKFILFLGHPLYAVSVVLCGFLVFSGLGSRFAGRLQGGREGSGVLASVTALIGLAILYLWALPELFTRWMAVADPLKIGISLALIAPLAFVMGMPFPLGLSRVAERASELVPWAWGVNGCASLISAVLATLLAIHLGFSLVVLAAVALYALAAAIKP